MACIRPRALAAGDTVAVLSPSWGGPATFPHIYERGLQVLRQVFGLTIKEYPTTRAPAEVLYANPQARAHDLNQAFADPDVKAIFASIGGDDSVRLLPFVDEHTIHENPKILLGYSDTTTLLTYGNQLGLVTFHGPSIMAGFAQLPKLPSSYAAHIRTMLFEAPPAYAYLPYEVWCDGYPDWNDRSTVGQVNTLHANTEQWRWLQGDTVAQGELFGGCIEVLEFLKGTAFWPAPDFWHGKVLFFETSEEVPTPTQVKYMLRNYGMQGIFDRIAGILVGRPRDYTDAMKRQLEEVLVTVVAGEFGRPELPIIANMDFGHTDPQWIVPLGVRTRVDCGNRTVQLVEAACAR